MHAVIDSKNVLVAPLNWGLGHATRCIPIIQHLILQGFSPILASDGQAMELLQKEFPQLTVLELPSYKIEYPSEGADFRKKMLKSTPGMIEAIRWEKKLVKKWVREYDLCGIISDNRPGVRNKNVPSVFITHQLNVLTGSTTWISSKIHQYIIRKFTECWVPDCEFGPNLSGKLGHLQKQLDQIRYIGPLSRFSEKKETAKYALTIVLSGPEPQRTLLEAQLRTEINRYGNPVLFIRGAVESRQTVAKSGNVTFYNFMTSEQLQSAFNESELILARSGYSTIMDLSAVGTKCFLIPTPGQFEQEYLAEQMASKGYAPFAKQADFKIEQLDQIANYNGIPRLKSDVHWKNLFSLFERK